MIALSVLLPFFFGVQSGLVPAGTRVDARLESTVQTATSNSGDAIVAVVAEPIRAAGRIVVPEGSRLNGRVETIEAASRSSEGRVRLVFREIQFPDGRTVATWITNSYSAPTPKRGLRHLLYMGVGGGAGAFIGGKAARVTGIIGGTLVGFIIASNSDDSPPDLTLRPGRLLRLELGEDLRMDSVPNPAAR
jgi:hypothetical protein